MKGFREYGRKNNNQEKYLGKFHWWRSLLVEVACFGLDQELYQSAMNWRLSTKKSTTKK